MYTPQDLENAVRDHPLQAADALAGIQLGDSRPLLVAEALNVTASTLGSDPGRFWVQLLDERGLLPAFANALATRGVPIDLEEEAFDQTHVPFEIAAAFPDRAKQFRCLIHRNGTVSGSGILVAPSTVLTAWHVVGQPARYAPDGPMPPVQVELSDGRVLRATIASASPCAASEFGHKLPANDNAVQHLHDIALLRLAQPVGATLGYADIADPPIPYRRPGPLYLVHHPQGTNRGLGEGVTEKIRSLTARVGHDILTEGGSSGGGCFDRRRVLVGVHQGQKPNGRGRFVPVERFIDLVRAVVAADIAPPTMWSIDGTPNSPLVIGREGFFQGFAAAMAAGPVRGIHVKRVSPAADPAGLPFSYNLLAGLVARDAKLRVCRISFEELTADIPSAIVRRVRDMGLDVAEVEARSGVATGESAPEAVGADRGRQAAEHASQAARASNAILWFFVDNPAIAFGDEQRAALEGFIDQALRFEHLRLVIAGYEAAAIPGREYPSGTAPTEGQTGLMTEYLAGFRREEVARMLDLAAQAAGYELAPISRDALASGALAGLDQVNGTYHPWLASDVAERLAEPVAAFFEQGGHG